MSPSKEDYLKKIVELGGQTAIINNKDLGEAMKVSPASVTDMNSRLLKEGLITRIPYKGVMLTEKGLKIANGVIRKHRLWEVFLAEKLGYNWNEVHDDADRLEHASSDLLIERLAVFLNNPKYDPHGGEIPSQNGEMEVHHYPVLNQLKKFDTFRIKEVEDNHNLLDYLNTKNIRLGNEFLLVEKEGYEGPLTLQNDENETFILSYKAAHQIFVEIID